MSPKPNVQGRETTGVVSGVQDWTGNHSLNGRFNSYVTNNSIGISFMSPKPNERGVYALSHWVIGLSSANWVRG